MPPRPPFLAFALLASATAVFAQGTLTPPGAPAPTMKTLTQIEPRTPLQAGATGVAQNANGGFTITASGSYYLTANLTVATGNAIAINSSGVTLDLNGFTLRSTAATANGNGVTLASGITLVTIRNGHIQGGTTYDGDTYSAGPGFSHGVFGPFPEATDSVVTVEDVDVTRVGADGIYLYGKSTIRRCRAQVCGDRGLNAAQITDSAAETCRGVALGAGTATNCTAASTHSVGLYAGAATNCTASSARSASGLYADTATNCRATSDSGIGLEAVTSAIGCIGKSSTGACGLKVGTADAAPIGGTAENCRGEITGTAAADSVGLFARTATNCIGANGAGTGLHATGSAVGCTGTSAGGIGLWAVAATHCTGTSSSAIGLHAEQTATGCVGKTATGDYGLLAGGTIFSVQGSATGCSGQITGSSTLSPFAAGLSAGIANDCLGHGVMTPGLRANTATNCYGSSTNSTGLMAGTATNCTGYTEAAQGTAIQATIAVSCRSNSGAINATQKFLGTP